MTVTLSIWLLPIAVTVAMWLVALFWPSTPSSARDYGFGAALDALARLVAVVVCTLLVWLVFFVAMWRAA